MRRCRVQCPGPRSCRSRLRGPGQTECCYNDRSEVVLGSHLQPSWIADDAVGCRAAVCAAEVLIVECIQEIGCYSHRSARECREILTEPQIHVAIGPRAREQWEALLRQCEAAGSPVPGIKPPRNVLQWSASQVYQTAELQTGKNRQIHDPVGGDVTLLVVRRVLGNELDVWESKLIARNVDTGDCARGVGEGQTRTPAKPACRSPIRPVDLDLQRIVPGAAAARGIQNVREAVERAAAEAAAARIGAVVPPGE